MFFFLYTRIIQLFPKFSFKIELESTKMGAMATLVAGTIHSKGTSAIQQYQYRIRVFLNLYLHKQLKFDNCLYITHTFKWKSDLFWSLSFLWAAILKCDAVALQCKIPTRSLLLFLWRVETGTAAHTRPFQDGGLQEMQWSKQIAWCELYTENYQIWAADIDTRGGKLLFEIDIVGEPRFPLNLP